MSVRATPIEAFDGRRAGRMLYVSLLVEALRARPALMFWIATLAQAFLWLLVPVVFYSAPPGELALTLAVGHHWPLGSKLGPPLAGWLAEIVFNLLGRSLLGLYLMSQVCVVVTFWAVFALGRSIVGVRHAVMAILLMVGVLAFSLPTPDFGPAVLAMPLAALALLHTWRALGEGRRHYWLAAGVDLGLLLLTTYAGLILVALLIGFIASTPRGRAAASAPDMWAAGMIVVLFAFPHLIWAEQNGREPVPDLSGLGHFLGPEGHIVVWLKLLLLVIAAHGLMLVLVVVAGGFRTDPRAVAPVFQRPPLDALARPFVYTFALAPALVATLIGGLLDRPAPVGGIGWTVVLSGLAVVVATGDAIRLHRARIVGVVWLALLLAPAVALIAGAALVPLLFGTDLDTNLPARPLAQFFTETFHRRTGRPLDYLVGEPRLAGAIALASRDRPYVAPEPGRDLIPWVSDEDIRRNGAVLVWLASDNAGQPPPSLKARFPDLVPEVPRSFERPLQGRLPLLRIGWAVIRPEVR